MNGPELAKAMAAVALHLWGEPSQRSNGEIRWGSHGSRAVNVGKGTWYDHEANEGGGVLDLVEREKGLRGADRLEWLRREGFEVPEPDGALNGHHARSKIVATYDYLDEIGAVAFQVVRLEPKTFRQRRPARIDDPPDKVRDGWVWSVKGVPLVPYRLPDIAEAIALEQTVFIVEGEKDANRLWSVNVPATCNPMGAGKWTAALNEHFRDASVVILPDNDDAGRQHAQHVAGALDGVAASVRFVVLPGLKPKGDVSDWLDAGGTVEGLLGLVEQPPATSHERAAGAIPLSLDDWLARDLPAPDFLMGSWLSTSSRALFVATTGLGKTNFALALALAIAAGSRFLHWQGGRRARVLVIDGEMSARLLKQRLADAARRFGSRPGGLMVLSHEDVPGWAPLNTPEGQQNVEAIIAQNGPVDLIIFDNIMCLIAGDMKDEVPWNDTLPWVRSLTRRSIGQLWVHHTGHDESRSYGTKTREWQMDTVLHATAVKRDDTDISFDLQFRKARERTPETRDDFRDVRLALVEDAWTYTVAAPDRKGKPSPLGYKFLQALTNVVASDASVTLNGQRAASTKHWIAECTKQGLLDPKAPANTTRAKFYKYRSELIAANFVACLDDHNWLG